MKITAAKRKVHSPEFRAKVALAAIKGESILAEPASRYGANQAQISKWKREAPEGMGDIFLGKIRKKDIAHKKEIEKSHAKIGQLTVERRLVRGSPSITPNGPTPDWKIKPHLRYTTTCRQTAH